MPYNVFIQDLLLRVNFIQRRALRGLDRNGCVDKIAGLELLSVVDHGGFDKLPSKVSDVLMINSFSVKILESFSLANTRGLRIVIKAELSGMGIVNHFLKIFISHVRSKDLSVAKVFHKCLA